MLHISAPHLPEVFWMLLHASKSSAFYEKSLWILLQAGNSLSNGQGGFFSLQPPWMRGVLKNKLPCPSAWYLGCLQMPHPPHHPHFPNSSMGQPRKCDVEIFGWTPSDPVSSQHDSRLTGLLAGLFLSGTDVFTLPQFQCNSNGSSSWEVCSALHHLQAHPVSSQPLFKLWLIVIPNTSLKTAAASPFITAGMSHP